MDTTPQMVLKSPGQADVVIKFDYDNREQTWLQHMVLLPWVTPQRLVGFVHPTDEDKVPGVGQFVLHGAFAYHGSVGVQPAGENKIRAIEVPKILLPYDLISPVDMRIHTCPTAIWMRDQGRHFQETFARLLMQQVNPPRVELP